MLSLFFGNFTNPDAYLLWEEKIDVIFEYHHYSEKEKVKLVVSMFEEYATNIVEIFIVEKEKWKSYNTLMGRNQGANEKAFYS